MIEHISAATNDLRKFNEWYTTRDIYISDAVEFRCDDYTRFDDEATTAALLRIQRAMTLPASECKQIVISTINALITHCAARHADQVEANGRLYEGTS